MTIPTYHRPSGFKRLIVQTLSAAIVGDSATDTFTADSAHGLAVGDCLAATALGGASGIALLTRYFVVNVGTPTTLKLSATKGGSPITIGSGTDVTLVAIVETRFSLAQKAAANNETDSITWEGDNLKIKQDSLAGMTFVFDLDAVNTGAHQRVFGKTEGTADLPGGLTNTTGFGGGNDKGGVSCGVRLEADSIEVINGVESSVVFGRWLHQGTLTLLKAGDVQTGAKMGITQYSFAASRATVDILGIAIAGASSDGEFYFDGKVE
jgi:hypothetical protein